MIHAYEGFVLGDLTYKVGGESEQDAKGQKIQALGLERQQDQEMKKGLWGKKDMRENEQTKPLPLRNWQGPGGPLQILLPPVSACLRF